MTSFVTMEDALQAGLAVLRNGGLIVFPTETLYGLGCDARNEDALRRLYALKGRSAEGEAFKPPPVLVRDIDMLREWAEVPAGAQELIEVHWPGSLTLIVPALPHVSSLVGGVTDGRKTIGVRASAQPLARALVEQLGAPIVATSANLSGAQGVAAAPRVLSDVPSAVLSGVDAALDGGEVGGVASTVVDCTQTPPRVLRVGAVALNFGP